MTRLLFPLAAFLSLSVALATLRVLPLGLLASFPDMVGHIDATRVAFLAHIWGASVALAISVFQLMPRLRARRLARHRWLGRVYGAAILLGGAGALVMAPNANGGMVATVGFAALAVLWIGFTVWGIVQARLGNTALHRRFMIRSFALTFAAVTLRLELLPMMVLGMEYVDAIRILSWLSWVPNLLVAEWVLRRRA